MYYKFEEKYFPFQWYYNKIGNHLPKLNEIITEYVKVPGFNKDNLEITFNKDSTGLVIYVKGVNEKLNISIDKKYVIEYSNAVPVRAEIKDGLLMIELKPEPEEERGYKKIPIE